MSLTRAVALLALAAIFAALAYSAEQKSPEANKAEQELLQRYRDWETAIPKGDFTAFERNTTSDYTCTTRDGLLIDKQMCIALLKHATITLWKSDDLKVRIYGNAAVVTGRAMVNGKLAGIDENRVGRFTEMHVNAGGQWQLAASQFTPIAPPPSP